MANKTDNGANADLDNDGALFVQLHTANPTNTGSVAVSVAFPTRVAASLGTAAARARSNTADITTPAGATVAETISHVSLWTAATAGSCEWYGPLTASKAVAFGEKFRLVTGALVLAIN
jgi:hypothetical protein